MEILLIKKCKEKINPFDNFSKDNDDEYLEPNIIQCLLKQILIEQS
jgi:hypothetical protein